MPTATVSFATNRKPLLEGGQVIDFGPDFDSTLDELRFGLATVTFEAGQAFRSARAVCRFVSDPATPVDLSILPEDLEEGVTGSAQLFEKGRRVMRERRRDTLVYIHGYNTSFREAIAAAFGLQWSLRTSKVAPDVNVVCFTWPSDGRMTPWVAYRADRLDALVSGAAVGRAVLKLRDFLKGMDECDRCERNLHLLCHSMGNFVLQHAIQHMTEFVPHRMPRVFDEAVLVAADVDADCFEHARKLLELDTLARRVHVYFNREDRAMQLSRHTKGNPERLGSNGPSNSALVPDKVQSVDCTKVVRGDVSEHGYHLDDRVLADVANALAGHAPNAYRSSRRTWDERRRRWELLY